MTEKKTTRLIAVTEVAERTGLSKTTIYRLERKGKFPRHVKLTPTRSAWAEHEIDSYIENLLAQRPESKPRRSRSSAAA